MEKARNNIATHSHSLLKRTQEKGLFFFFFLDLPNKHFFHLLRQRSNVFRVKGGLGWGLACGRASRSHTAVSLL